MAESQNQHIMRGLYAAYASRDPAALLGPLAEDFEIYQSELLPWGGRYKGHDGMMEFVKGITTHIDSVVDVEEMIEAGDHVIVLGRSTGKIKATGEDYSVRLVDVCELKDGKIKSIEIYLDMPAFLEKLPP